LRKFLFAPLSPLIIDIFYLGFGNNNTDNVSKIITAGFKCMMHMNTICTSIEIIEVLSKSNGKGLILKAGDTGKIRIKLNNPICFTKYNLNSYLGIIVLRSSDCTFAFGGIV